MSALRKLFRRRKPAPSREQLSIRRAAEAEAVRADADIQARLGVARAMPQRPPLL